MNEKPDVADIMQREGIKTTYKLVIDDVKKNRDYLKLISGFYFIMVISFIVSIIYNSALLMILALGAIIIWSVVIITAIIAIAQIKMYKFHLAMAIENEKRKKPTKSM